MSLVKSKNTSPERLVFSYLRKRGVYFRRHYAKAPGNPDVAIPSRQKAVFIDGGFWHGWDFSRKRSGLPDYWKGKIENNIKRDRRNRTKLRRLGWKVLRVWDHDLIRHEERVLMRIEAFLLEGFLNSQRPARQGRRVVTASRDKSIHHR